MKLSDFIKRTEDVEDVLKIQTSDGNWNYDPYMHGLANGMKLVHCIMQDKNYDPLEAPEKWLCNEVIESKRQYWIDSKGKIYKFTGEHVEFIVKKLKYDKSYKMHPIDMAQKMGWIRLYGTGNYAVLDYDAKHVARLAMKTLYNELENSLDIQNVVYDDKNEFREITIDEFLRKYKRFR